MRLKSDDIQNKKRIKSNSIYLINQSSAHNINPKDVNQDVSIPPANEIRTNSQGQKHDPPILMDKGSVNRHRVITTKQQNQHSGRTVISTHMPKNQYSDFSQISQIDGKVVESPMLQAVEIRESMGRYPRQMPKSGNNVPLHYEKTPETSQSQSFQPSSGVIKP